jgi:glycosyltransferase involved in cell wall biosynthesis
MKKNDSFGGGKGPKILFVTDVPVWRQRTGAQQRIMSLINYFSGLGWPVSLCYLGSRTAEWDFLVQIGHVHGKEILKRLDVVSLTDDWSPNNLWEALTWQIRCIANRLRLLFAKSPRQPPTTTVTGKQLHDFVSPELRSRFQRLVDESKPDIVIVEYLTLVYLVPPPDQRKGIQYWVDTHDVLSSRCQQFKQLGADHWVVLSEAEEQSALDQFDGIIAIQPNEAEQFQKMVTRGQPVVIAGYASCDGKPAANLSLVDLDSPSKRETSSAPSVLTYGVLASNNSVNVDAVRWLVDQVWPHVQKKQEGIWNCQLIVAGAVCREFSNSSLAPNIRCIDTVDCLHDFYDQIDVVVNPIQFGTGLKIKNVEALAFGKPLITTSHGIEGWHAPTENQPLPWIEANTVEEFASAMALLASDSSRRLQMIKAAFEISETELSAETVYRSLTEHFSLP